MTPLDFPPRAPSAMRDVAEGFAVFAFLLLITAAIPAYIVICLLGWL